MFDCSAVFNYFRKDPLIFEIDRTLGILSFELLALKNNELEFSFIQAYMFLSNLK